MSSNIIIPLNKKPEEWSEKLEKASGNLDDTKAPVVMICRKYLYNKKEKENNKKYTFQEKSASSKRWFDPDHERSEENVITREPDFY